jgi:hypothetical protein
MRVRDDPDLWAVAILSVALAAGPVMVERIGFGGHAPRIVLAVESTERLGDAIARHGSDLLEQFCARFRRLEPGVRCERELY